MKEKPIILSIAGSDPTGGAGIQADIKTAVMLECYPCSVISAITAQNSDSIRGIWGLGADKIKAQLQSVLEEYEPSAVKIGMVASAEAVDTIADILESSSLPNIVVDPVLSTTVDGKVPEPELIREILERLFPIASLVTPNLKERDAIENLTGQKIETLAEAVMLKGGHGEKDTVTDTLYYREIPAQGFNSPSTAFPTINMGHSSLYNQDNLLPVPPEGEPELRIREFHHQRIETSNTHGSGCVLSTAVACFLAEGFRLEAAVEKAIKFTTDAMRRSANNNPGKGTYGPVLI